MTTLFFEPHITGHRQEYLNHLIDYIVDNQPSGNFIFVVHPDFEARTCLTTAPQPATSNQQPATSNLKVIIEPLLLSPSLLSPRKRGPIRIALSFAKVLLHSLTTFRLADYYARQHHAGHVCFLNFNDVQFALGLFRPKYSVSGILFKPFARQQRDSFWHRLTWQRKYFQTWFFTRNRQIKNLFVLNDHKSADYLNRTFHTAIFQMLPDPVPKLTPEPGFDVRKHFGISPDRKLFLHIGSLLKRKGTLDILDSLRYLSDEELSRFALLIIGHADPAMDTEIRKRLRSTSNQQQATSIRYYNEFLSSSVFKSCIDQCDLVLVPYRYTESSSGIAGHAFAAGKPLLGVRKGLLGEMIGEYGTGIFIDEYGPTSITKGIKRALAADLTGKTSLRFLQMHTKEAFAGKIIASITR